MKLTYRTRNGAGEIGGTLGVLTIIAAIVAAVAAYLTHIGWILITLTGSAPLTGGKVLVGALGLFVPPVGMVHGVMLWFGLAWG